jgi:hypothetical protein
MLVATSATERSERPASPGLPPEAGAEVPAEVPAEAAAAAAASVNSAKTARAADGQAVAWIRNSRGCRHCRNRDLIPAGGRRIDFAENVMFASPRTRATWPLLSESACGGG